MTMERLLNIIQKNVPQLFMLVFIIAWSGAKAQYPYNFSYAGVQFETKTIVRNYDGQHAVVYYEENGKDVEDYNVIRRNEIGASNNTFRYDQYCPTASVLYMDTASVGVVIPFQCVHE